MAEAVDGWKFVPGINTSNNKVGPDIASAATIAPTAMIHQVTGAVAIVNITPPDPLLAAVVYLIAAAGSAWTWTAAGNITLASAAAQTVGKAVGFLFNPVTQKWSPLDSAAG